MMDRLMRALPGVRLLQGGRPLLGFMVALAFWTSGGALMKVAVLDGPMSVAVDKGFRSWAVGDAWRLKEDRSSYGVDDVYALNIQDADQSLRRIQPIVSGYMSPYPEYPYLLTGLVLAFLLSIGVTVADLVQRSRR